MLARAALVSLALAVASSATAAAPETTERGCGSRGEPSATGSPDDIVIGSVRAHWDFRETPARSFASRADDVGFRRYIDGPRGRALPEEERERLLRLARSHYGQLKAPVSVRAGRVVTLSVAPEDRRHASFFFHYTGRPRGRQIGPYWSFRVSDGAPRVRFRSCRRDQPMFSGPGPVGPLTSYPGAMIVAGARCVTFEVRERGRRTVRRQVPFGVPDCD